MKNVIYTAIVGKYDRLAEPTVLSPGFQYICFTDNPRLQSKHWNIVQLPVTKLDSTRLARRVKILFHQYLPDADLSIWVDANLNIVSDFNQLLKSFDTSGPLTTITHPHRQCIYEEAKACTRLKKDAPDIIKRQVAGYRNEGLPKNLGLVNSALQIRRHNSPELQSFVEAWWGEVSTKSRRDQLSFNYVLWKTPIEVNYVPQNKFFGHFVRIVKHSRR
jgi:hypothetical protein